MLQSIHHEMRLCFVEAGEASMLSAPSLTSQHQKVFATYRTGPFRSLLQEMTDCSKCVKRASVGNMSIYIPFEHPRMNYQNRTLRHSNTPSTHYPSEAPSHLLFNLLFSTTATTTCHQVSPWTFASFAQTHRNSCVEATQHCRPGTHPLHRETISASWCDREGNIWSFSGK